MSKLKREWEITDIPKDITIKLWRLMRDAKTFVAWQQAIANEDINEDEEKYIRTSRDSYKRLQDEIRKMPASEVVTLPEDLQNWIMQLRPDLGAEVEQIKQGTKIRAVLKADAADRVLQTPVAYTESPLIKEDRRQHLLDLRNMGLEVIALFDAFFSWTDYARCGAQDFPPDPVGDKWRQIGSSLLFKCLESHTPGNILWDDGMPM